jgi:iron complex transport system substrate-binding protein
MKLRDLILVVLASLALAFSACGDDDGEEADDTPSPTADAAGTPSPTAAPFPVSITDDNDVSVTLEAAPERIVALAPSFVEVLFAIGAGDAIVAADETPTTLRSHDIPKVSITSRASERITSYEPDLVLMCFDAGAGLAYQPDDTDDVPLI